MPLEWAVIAAAVTPHIKKYVTEKAAKLASGYADGKVTQFYKRLLPDQKLHKAVESFVAAFDKELRSSIENATLIYPVYQEALKIFLSDPDVLEALETPLDGQSEPDWEILKSRWAWLRDSQGQPLIALPEEFDWDDLTTRYGKSLQKQALADPELRQVAQALATLQIKEDTKRGADAAERLAGTATDFDLKGYRDFLRKKCSTLQLAVMHTSTYQYDRKVTLWSTFVPQSARESAPIPEMPRDIELRLRKEGHLLEERDERQLEEFRQRYQASAVSPVLDILERSRLVVILGNPGSGKTSLLKYLALRWVNDNHGPVPLFIDLREYIKERIGLPEYFDKACASYRLDMRELDKRLKTGDAALFLDGLDEIFDASIRSSVITEVIALSSRYPQAPIFLTSRSFGYEPERLQSADFRHVTLENFDDQQLKNFLHRWHENAEEEPKERERLQARIERALGESRAIRELAGNPLLLTMMAILNRNQELPRDRVELYREASRVLLGEWDASRALPVDDFGRQEKESLLRELAGEMQQAEGGIAGNLIERSRLIHVFQVYLSGLGIHDSFFKAKQLVHQLTERNFVLTFAGANHFSFVHRTFLEYYCAAWFVERFEKKQDLTLQDLQNEIFARHWSDENWHEILRLIAGMLDEKKAEKLILFLMDLDGNTHRLANLMVAAGCLSDIRNRRAIESTDQALWKRFAKEAIHYDLPSGSFEKYQLVPSVREAAILRIAITWRSLDTYNWLKDRLRSHESDSVRQAAVRALAQEWKQQTEILTCLKELADGDGDIAVRQVAVQEIARSWKQDPKTLPFLKERVRFDDNWIVRQAALRELARGWKDDPETLSFLKRHVRDDRHADVRQAAVQELARGWRHDPKMELLLTQSARSDENWAVRQTAVQELARGWKHNPDILLLLKECARSDKYWDVRRAAVQELARGWKHDAEIFVLLKELLSFDRDIDVRLTAIQELARGWKDNNETLDLLKDLVVNGEMSSQRLALQEILRGWKEDSQMLSFLKKHVFSGPSLTSRQMVVQELAREWSGNAETMQLLKELARSDKDPDTRLVALRELMNGWKEHAAAVAFLKEVKRFEQDEIMQRALKDELRRLGAK